MSAKLTPAYAGVMKALSPVVRLWGRMQVSGLEHLPPTGPVLLAGNHDSYWDPISIGMAARPVRQIHALAKAELWGSKPLGVILDGMGQIPIERGKSDAAAMSRAIESLRGGICIGVFPEGTRSRGNPLRARSGFGRLAAQGRSGPEIAADLGVSPSTIKTHFENIYEKLGVSDRAGAVAHAMRIGLVD